MSHHLIEARDVWFAYPQGADVLRGLSFRITHGEAVGLIGCNGAGKSTLLMHLNGFLTPRCGEIPIGDTPLTAQTVAAARRAVGVVFQDPDDQLFMPTVAEDVAFGPLNLGLPLDEVAQRVGAALERVGMTSVRERPPYKLSAGEKRAVAIATVLAMMPDILVMDEPTSSLDSRGRRRLIELLRGFEHTRIIATHDLELVVEICSRVLIMDEGRIVADGPARTILGDRELLHAHGLERPHSLSHAHAHTAE